MKKSINIEEQVIVRKLILKIHYIIILLFLSAIFIGCTKNKNTDVSSNKIKEYYTCPMHPQIHEDKPGSCPICGMDLVKKIDSKDTKQNATNIDIEKMISLNKNEIIMANVETIVVKNETFNNSLKAYSYLDFNEENQKTISARFNGRVEKLYVNQTGINIKKGQALFDIYSPDIVQVQNDYIIALKNKEANNAISNVQLITSIRKRLELAGLSDRQIDKIENSKEPDYKITFYSPSDGIVIEKKIKEGMYITEGMPLYETANLSTIWNIAEVFEKDIALIKVGSSITLKTNSLPEKIYTGKVTFIYPVLNEQNRTIKVRSVISNTKNELKPQMYGEVSFKLSGVKGIFVPDEAILFTGKRNIIWIKTKDNTFISKTVEIGIKIDGKYQILNGLKDGDEIVKTGGFLLDSESQLKSGM